MCRCRLLNGFQARAEFSAHSISVVTPATARSSSGVDGCPDWRGASRCSERDTSRNGGQQASANSQRMCKRGRPDFSESNASPFSPEWAGSSSACISLGLTLLADLLHAAAVLRSCRCDCACQCWFDSFEHTSRYNNLAALKLAIYKLGEVSFEGSSIVWPCSPSWLTPAACELCPSVGQRSPRSASIKSSVLPKFIVTACVGLAIVRRSRTKIYVPVFASWRCRVLPGSLVWCRWKGGVLLGQQD